MKLLLSHVDTEKKLFFTTEQIDLLYTLIDEKSIYNSNLNSLQLRTLEMFRLILAPTVIEKIYLIAGSNCANVLEKAYHDTQSQRIRYLIKKQFTLFNYTNQNFEVHSTSINVGINLNNDKIKQFSNRNKKLKYIILFRQFSFVLFIILPGLIAGLFSGSSFLAQGIIQISLCAPCILFISIYSKLYFQVPKVDSRDIYSHKSVIDHLSVFKNYHSYFIKNIIISSIIENIDISTMHPLISTGLDELHNILCPPKLIKSQLTKLYATPLPDIVFIPVILRGLVYLGDHRSVKVIEKFSKFTNNENYKHLALECLEALKNRLKEKPEQLLRASSMSDNGLLKASQATSRAQGLLKPVNDDDHIVFTLVESIVEEEVNRQQL